jgi:hypothetical protein
VRRRHRRRAGLQAVGLIVEGDTEFLALPQLPNLVSGCPPLRATNLGGVGETRTCVGIAKLVAPKVIAHRSAGRSHVVVCIDREGREECPPRMASLVYTELSAELLRRSCEVGQLDIVILDRAFEAWILAEADGLADRGEFCRSPWFHCFEGQMGERGRKGVIELEKLLGRGYSKRKDGPRLFAGIDFDRARDYHSSGRGSKSLDKFLRVIGV